MVNLKKGYTTERILVLNSSQADQGIDKRMCIHACADIEIENGNYTKVCKNHTTELYQFVSILSTLPGKC